MNKIKSVLNEFALRDNGGKIVLLLIDNDFTPYVTYYEDKKGNHYLGHYYKFIEQAREDYIMRCRIGN